jgi:glucose-fructose oxidoreductase
MQNRSRREFLKRVGLSAAVYAGASGSGAGHRTFEAEENTRPVRYAIVGIGAIAGEMMPALAQARLSKLTGFVSGHPEKARHFAQLYGVPEKNIYTYENYDQIASNPEIDAVYIALPNSMHAEYTIRAAKAGKHVLCEKPMCTSVADAEAMVSACRDARRRLMVAYRLHYERYNLEAMKMCREKQFGPIRAIDAEFAFVIGDPKQWRLNHALSGGGSLMDIGIYCLQATRYLSGEEPASVNAQMWSSDPVKFSTCEESIAFTLKFPSGILANCYSSYGVDGVNRYRAAGPGGWVQMDPAYTYMGLVQQSYQHGKTTVTQPSTWDQFAAEADEFSDAIRHDRDVATPGEEGLRDMKILMACYESARSGKSIELG